MASYVHIGSCNGQRGWEDHEDGHPDGVQDCNAIDEGAVLAKGPRRLVGRVSNGFAGVGEDKNLTVSMRPVKRAWRMHDMATM